MDKNYLKDFRTKLSSHLGFRVKSVSDIVYFIQNELIFYASVSYNKKNSNVFINTSVKPLVVDNAFWEIIGEKKFRDSHRIMGAFVVPAFHLPDEWEGSLHDENWYDKAITYVSDAWKKFSNVSNIEEFRKTATDLDATQFEEGLVLDLMLRYVSGDFHHILAFLQGQDLNWINDKFSFETDDGTIGFRELLKDHIENKMINS